MRAARIALPLCLALSLGAAPAIWATASGAAESEESEGEAATDAAPAPTIYKWIDEHGVAHYTTDRDQIPREVRNKVGKLGPPDAALRRTPVEASAPPIPTQPVPDFDDGEQPPLPTRPVRRYEAQKYEDGEQWAVRDRTFERPRDAWDEGDPYASFPSSELGEDETFVSEVELEERRQRLEDIEQAIASLQTDIAASEEALKALLVIPVLEGGGPLAMADDPTFREAADRLPELLSDLRALEDERAELQAP
jgi:hypothetical protein